MLKKTLGVLCRTFLFYIHVDKLGFVKGSISIAHHMVKIACKLGGNMTSKLNRDTSDV